MNYAEHLIGTLKAKYETKQDWTGGLYCDITLKCNYSACILDISIPGYATEALHKFQHPTPYITQQYTHQWLPTKYIATTPQIPKNLMTPQ